MGLKVVQVVAEKHGLKLSVGDLDAEEIIPVMAENEGPQPKEVASRIAAHIGHRIPGVKKLEKRFEGRDKTSGILSDVGILLGQLYVRNKPLIEEIVTEILRDSITLRKTAGTPHGTPEHIDFGTVHPSENGHNGG